MTDKELRNLVASLAKAQARTDAQLKELAAQIAKTDAQLAETDAQIKETSAQLKETDAKIKRISEMVGGMSNNDGYFAEETFFKALEKNPRLGSIVYNEVSRSWKKRIKYHEEEFDIVMTNDSSVGLVEVKYRLHPNDVKKFYTKKLPIFTEFFPEFKNKQIQGAVAALSFSRVAVATAKNLGLYVMTIEGQELKFL